MLSCDVLTLVLVLQHFARKLLLGAFRTEDSYNLREIAFLCKNQ